MSDFKKTQTSQTTILIVISLIGVFITLWFKMSKDYSFSIVDKTQKQEIIQTEKNKISTKQVEEWLNSLPNSAFKSNLLTVFGAEYGGDSEELNKLMKAFIEIRTQELIRDKKI